LAPPPLYPDESKVGAPWSGLQLAVTPAAQGIFVGQVSRDSPAESSGILAGDFIFELSGHPVSDAREIQSEVEHVGIGGSVRLGVHRGSHVRLFRVEPVPKPAAASTEEASAQSAATPQPSAELEESRRGN
jgi:S1-C subfamily serine protease